MRPARQPSQLLVRAVAWDPNGLRETADPSLYRRHPRRARKCGAMTSGWIILVRSKPDSETIGVFVMPPGTRTLTVTPVPSRSFAMIALSASSAALDGP